MPNWIFLFALLYLAILPIKSLILSPLPFPPYTKKKIVKGFPLIFLSFFSIYRWPHLRLSNKCFAFRSAGSKRSNMFIIFFVLVIGSHIHTHYIVHIHTCVRVYQHLNVICLTKQLVCCFAGSNFAWIHIKCRLVKSKQTITRNNNYENKYNGEWKRDGRIGSSYTHYQNEILRVEWSEQFFGFVFIIIVLRPWPLRVGRCSLSLPISYVQTGKIYPFENKQKRKDVKRWYRIHQVNEHYASLAN